VNAAWPASKGWVDEQWSKLRPLKPGEEKRWDGNRLRPTYLKEAVAARRGVTRWSR
jgi:hypothetical protein